MGKSQETFNKKEKEKKRRKKKKEKMERRLQRKAEKAERGGKTFEEMISYVDEYGNLTDTPPDPAKKIKVNAEDIIVGIPPKEDVEVDPIRKGKVKFFNDEKGYGFIVDMESQDSIFVHMSAIATGDIAEGDKVTFEIEKGPKGLAAARVQVVSEFPTKPPPKPVVDETEETSDEVENETKSEEEDPATNSETADPVADAEEADKSDTAS